MKCFTWNISIHLNNFNHHFELKVQSFRYFRTTISVLHLYSTHQRQLVRNTDSSSTFATSETLSETSRMFCSSISWRNRWRWAKADIPHVCGYDPCWRRPSICGHPRCRRPARAGLGNGAERPRSTPHTGTSLPKRCGNWDCSRYEWSSGFRP